MTTKIYIAGKVTGLPVNECLAKFQTAQEQLAQKGYEVINPITLINNPNEVWNKAMRTCIQALTGCDAIYLLPDFKNSRGAMLELQVAVALGIKIYAAGYAPPCIHSQTYKKITDSFWHCETTVLTCQNCETELAEPETDC